MGLHCHSVSNFYTQCKTVQCAKFSSIRINLRPFLEFAYINALVSRNFSPYGTGYSLSSVIDMPGF